MDIQAARSAAPMARARTTTPQAVLGPALSQDRFQSTGTPAEPLAAWRDQPAVSNSKAMLGAGLGGLALGGLGAAFSPIAGLVGGLVGAVVGGAAGRYSEILAYDGKAKAKEAWNHVDTALHQRAHRNQRDSAGPLPGLTREHLRALDRVGDVRREYDGWDSGRDLFALSSKEGAPQSPYQVQIEVAHLREGAQFESTLQLTLAPVGDGSSGSPLEIVVKNGRAFQKLADQWQPLEGVKVGYDPKFSHIRLDLDKAPLRSLGWSDGTPLQLSATTLGKDGAVSDQMTALSGTSMEGSALTDGFTRWEGKTVYYVVTDRFHNGDKTNDDGTRPENIEAFHGGDYQGVIEKLDYLKDLGVDCIWLSCPYENDRNFFGNDGYHGYWPHDFNAAEPSFGSKEKLKELSDLAHAKGMKVMLDVVTNHTGYQHPFTQQADKSDWYHHNGKLRWIGQNALETQDLAGLPDLALENPEVSDHVIEAHKSWLKETGVDAFRLDAVRHVPKGFSREFVESMKEENPDFFSVGEVFWRNPNHIATYQRETQESMFDFPLAYAIRNVFSGDPDRTRSERFALAGEVGKHNITESVRLRTSNGDESMKLLSKALAADDLYDNPKKLMTFVDNHDMMRFMSDCKGDTKRLHNALGFLYAVRGIPSLYYGTESAMDGWGPENRKDMQWDESPETKEVITQLTSLRKESAALQFGTQRELMVRDDAYALARIRTDEQVICVFNNASEERVLTIPVDESLPNGSTLQNMLAEGSARVTDGNIEITMAPRSFAYYGWRASEG